MQAAIAMLLQVCMVFSDTCCLLHVTAAALALLVHAMTVLVRPHQHKADCARQSSDANGSAMSVGSKLEAALVANAVKLSKGAAAGLPETWNLVQVEMAATNFSSYAAAAAPSIHKFLQHSKSRPSPSAGQHIPAQAEDRQQSPAACVTDGTADTAKCLARQQSVVQSSEAPKQRESGLQASQQLQHEAERDCMADKISQVAARQCSDVDGHLQDSSMYHGVDIEQQRQMLREIELRHNSARQRSLSQVGMKRPHANQQSKLGVKQSKSEHTTGPGQRTITSLFGKGL